MVLNCKLYWKESTKTTRVIFGLVFTAIIALLLLWLVGPFILRDYLNKRGSQLPDFNCHIESIQLEPLTCGITLSKITLVKKYGHIPVPFLDCSQVHVALQWREILHGSLRSNIVMTQPIVNFVQGPTKEQSQTFLEPEWVDAVKKLVPLRINRFEVHRGDVHYYEFNASPKIDLEMDEIEVTLDNLTNSSKVPTKFPSTVQVKGRPFKRGNLELHMTVNVDIKQPTFKDQFRIQNIPAPALNSFLAKYAGVYAKSGDLAFYSEMVSENGSFKGYFKPFFQDISFEPMPQDREGLEAIWASILNGLKSLVEDDRDIVATQIPVSGNYKEPDIDFISAAFGIIKNAYFETLAQGFKKPELAPTPEKQTE